MNKDNPLWVCSKCHVLQGIEVWVSNDELQGRCVNCGVPTNPTDVSFLDIEKAAKVIEITTGLLPQEFHDYTRYSWVSRRTVGLIFEFSLNELAPLVDFDPHSFFEDEIGPNLDLTMTVFFEN